MEQDKTIGMNISPEAIVVPTGGTKRDKDGNYHSTSYDDGDAFGTLGGYVRVEAAAELARMYPETMVVTTGKGAGDGISPSHAMVMENELVALGIESKRVIREEDSTTTRSNIEQALKIANKYKWSSIIFVSNEYHLPRLRAMLEILGLAIKIDFVAAEDVISKIRPEFGKIFKNIKITPAYKRRLESEARGIQALNSGEYHSAPIEDKKERLV